MPSDEARHFEEFLYGCVDDPQNLFDILSGAPFPSEPENGKAWIASAKGKPSFLIPDASVIEQKWLDGVSTILLTSGASVPESLVQDVISYLKNRGPCTVEERELIQEDVHFRLPVAVA